MKTKEIKQLYLPDIVGKGYATYWNFKGLYRVCKGSRASKKSKTTALNYITRIMEYSEANLLVVRKTYRTMKDSCFAELKWAIHRLQVDSWWKIKESPLEMTYKPTGQKIYFRGLDDPLKVTSITVDIGYLCWLWIEEAYEISSEDDFNTLDESIRGKVPEGLFKQATLTFNPWNEHHWIKKKFFDVEDEDILAITTNYLCNEWLDEKDHKKFQIMKERNPRRYKVAGLGDWGIVDGLVFENWTEKEFDINTIRGQQGIKSAFGLDFGYTNDPSTLFCGLVDEKNKIIYVFDEMYEEGMSNEKIAKRITSMGYAKEKIRADSAEPKSIDRLRDLGLSHIRKARKEKDSISKENIVEPPLTIVGPTIESLKYTFDSDDPREMYLNLLASSMNIETIKNTHPAYVDIIKQMTTLDAHVFKDISHINGNIAAARVMIGFDNQVYTKAMPNIFAPDLLNDYDPFLVSSSIENLCRLGLISYLDNTIDGINYDTYKEHQYVISRFQMFKEIDKIRNLHINVSGKALIITDFGKNFAKVCL